MFDLIWGILMASEANLGLRLLEGPAHNSTVPVPEREAPERLSLVEPLTIEEIFSWQGQSQRGRAGHAPACGK